jgi:hypothetical protein
LVAFDDDMETFEAEAEDDSANDENILASVVKCLKLEATRTKKPRPVAFPGFG